MGFRVKALQATGQPPNGPARMRRTSPANGGNKLGVRAGVVSFSHGLLTNESSVEPCDIKFENFENRLIYKARSN
jgi:hypothetical protein